MGDNARHAREWHNVEVGQGYQARGVVRQPGSQPTSQVKLLDLSKPQQSTTVNTSQSATSSAHDAKDKKKKEKHKSASRHHKSSKKKDKKAKKASFHFNPLLQLLATRLSDKTLSFN